MPLAPSLHNGFHRLLPGTACIPAPSPHPGQFHCLQKALSGEVDSKEGTFAIGADYAESRDKCIAVIGQGGRVLEVKEWPGMTTSEFARILYNEMMKLGKNQAFMGVDSIGPGSGVYHALVELGIGYRVEPCRYKNYEFESKFDKSQIKVHFNNFRSQAYWSLAEDFEVGKIDLSRLQDSSGYYANLHLLQEELMAHTYSIDNGIMHIISKNELRKADMIGRSPDRSDALAIWNVVRKRTFHRSKKKMGKSLDYGRMKHTQFKRAARTEAEAWC